MENKHFAEKIAETDPINITVPFRGREKDEFDFFLFERGLKKGEFTRSAIREKMIRDDKKGRF